ncbi:(Fe-S)-binding protein [Kineosporia sp. A_224]|uniref:(Fe-S)-binding protein n=1 Tax=Kineosporia sp. A_224 TaxID=1962180 RepID=UPI000B4B28FE|nr:(Fe-S)-binding protein [Kineosporia sp. A_224]
MTGPEQTPDDAPVGAEPVAPRGIFDPDLLSACISCGFCLPACPTYALTQDERSSPRGRISLMRALEEGRLDEDDPTLVEQASFCLGCRACEPVCPAGVQYGALFEQWRDHQWRGRRAPVRARALRAATGVTPAITAAGVLRGAARRTGPPDADKVHLMLGCAERALFPGVSRAVVELLPGAVDVPSGQGCCGALHGHNGDSAEGVRLATELGRRMPGTVLVTAGGCATHLAHMLGRDRVRELSEFLVERWDAAPDAAPVLGEVRAGGRRARVGLQDSCHLRNGLGVVRPPRDLVARVADYVELPSAGRCCGSAGTYAMLRPEDSRAVLDVHLDEIEAADLDHLVVVNVVCQKQLVEGLRRRRSRTTVLHLAELLAVALRAGGGPAA